MLQLGNNYALAPGGLAANGGTLDLDGCSPTVGSLSGGTAGVITLSGTTNSTLTVNQAATTTFAGTLNDGLHAQLGLVKSGSGALLLTGNNNYSGATVNGGTLETNLAGSGMLTINAGGTYVNLNTTSGQGSQLPMTIDGGTLYTNNGWTYCNTLSMTGGQVTALSGGDHRFIIDITAANTSDITIDAASTTATIANLSMDSRQLAGGSRHYVQINVVADPSGGGPGLDIPGVVSDSLANGWGGSAMGIAKTGAGALRSRGPTPTAARRPSTPARCNWATAAQPARLPPAAPSSTMGTWPSTVPTP